MSPALLASRLRWMPRRGARGLVGSSLETSAVRDSRIVVPILGPSASKSVSLSCEFCALCRAMSTAGAVVGVGYCRRLARAEGKTEARQFFNFSAHELGPRLVGPAT